MEQPPYDLMLNGVGYYLAATPESKRSAQMLAKLRRLKWLTCPICGKEFEGLGRRVYCGRPCRSKAYAQRKRQKAKEASCAQPESDNEH